MQTNLNRWACPYEKFGGEVEMSHGCSSKTLK